MDNRKKKAAAIAAVIAHIRNQEDALAMQASAVVQAPQPSPISLPEPLKLWGVSGRQTQMLMRSHMQFKAYHLVK